jgi:DNA helicase IV
MPDLAISRQWRQSGPVASCVPMSDSPFPELEIERSQLTYARACRDAMIDRFQRLDPNAAADVVTKEYVEVTVADALADLQMPGAGDFFGRIDEEGGDRWYVGRRHIESDNHDPVVVDWRAPIAAPFYRATVADSFGLTFRRRFTLEHGEMTTYFDEHLDDPTAADVATGIPDPVLAEIGAARTGAMREIVATIQAEQDEVIRAPLDGCLVVQGGPGTGKTAVGLHRAAYLMFEHRKRLAREGVLVVGPNKVFLDYIANVLPSLGERSVRQCTALDFCVPRVDVDAIDSVEMAAAKGSEAMLDALADHLELAINPPEEDLRIGIGSRTFVFTAAEVNGWINAALNSGFGRKQPLSRRREGLKAIAQRELQRRSGNDDLWSKAAELKAALNKAWPQQQPKTVVQQLLRSMDMARSGKAKWSAADQFLIDEANSLLNGPPFVYGHVVVDEAQDHSAVALRCIGRRSTTDSITLLGDLAQSTTPAGQKDWGTVGRLLGIGEATVRELTIGYRVPAPILEVANRLLPLTGVVAAPSRSARPDGVDPLTVIVASAELSAEGARQVVEARTHHALVGVVAPLAMHGDIADALATHDFIAVDHVYGLTAREIPLFGPEEVKGLEFDAVVVVAPEAILGGTERGARLLYVSLTRAVHRLTMVTDRSDHSWMTG